MIAICHRCEKRGYCMGACPCTVDDRDIIAHAKAGYCPHPDGPKYGAADKPDGWDALPIAVAGEPPPPPEPFPREKWPWSVRIIARLKQNGEQGIGDTLARLIAGVGGEQYKALMEAIGVDCGCAARQAHLNAIYPYRGNDATFS